MSLAEVGAILGAESPTMPDFETVYLGAPFKADLRYRGGPKTVEVDEQFEVVIPSVSKADTTLVATVETIHGPSEFRHIGGRLFRPLLDDDGQGWTVSRLDEEPPPIFRLDTKPINPWRGEEGRPERLRDVARFAITNRLKVALYVADRIRSRSCRAQAALSSG